MLNDFLGYMGVAMTLIAIGIGVLLGAGFVVSLMVIASPFALAAAIIVFVGRLIKNTGV